MGLQHCIIYKQHNFENAYNEALKYDMPDLFWPYLLRAACLGKMKRPEEAKENVEKLFKLRTDFKEKAEYLIRMFVKEEDLVENVLDGLKNAGCLIS